MGVRQGLAPPGGGCWVLGAGKRVRIGHYPKEIGLAEDKVYKAEYLGSGTFRITKPKRAKAKRRQTNLKNPQRGARK